MVEKKNIIQAFRFKSIDKARNYYPEELKQNELMSEKHKKFYTTLYYIEHFLVLASTITGCVLISVFGSLVFLLGITSSAIGLTTCAIPAGIKTFKSIIKKKKKKHDKILFLAKTQSHPHVCTQKFKLTRIEVLISKALLDSAISHDEFVLINDVLKEYNNNESRNKNFEDLIHPSDLACVAKVSNRHVFDRTQKFIEDFSLFIKKCHHIA